MSNCKIFLTSSYQKKLTDVENFIWESTDKNISLLSDFLSEHENVLQFIKDNPNTPAPHPQTGDQSWPFGEGRYRLFFKFDGKNIFLLDLIDNRMSNLKLYPNNTMTTYNEE